MPLNEHEERILAEIERQFHANDPESARRIESTTLQRYLARNCRRAAFGFLVGLVVLLAAFATNLLLAGVAFLIMVASAVMFLQNFNKIGRLGLRSVGRTLSGPGLSSTVEDFSRRWRRRLGGDSD